MTRPEPPDQRAERLTAELRTATREAAEVLKDLTRAMRGTRAQVDEYLHDQVQHDLDKNTRLVQSLIDEWNRDMAADMNARIQASVNKASAAIDAATSIQMLVQAVAERVAANTRMIDGQPHIVYGIDRLNDPGTNT